MGKEINPKMMEDLSRKNMYFVLRTGKNILFCLITKPKFAITMELKFKTEEHAVLVEEWYLKKFTPKAGGA